MTRKTAVMRLMRSSTFPPEYAARMPSVVASTVASSAAAAPTTSDERAPQTTCEKMSDPWSVVPNRWCQDGDCRPSISEKSFGLACAIHGAMIATTMIEERTMIPPRDFGLDISSFSQPGRWKRRPRRALAFGAAHPRELDGRRGDVDGIEWLDLRHRYAVRTRGSRTKLSMSMMKLARITQTAKTSSSPCVSG